MARQRSAPANDDDLRTVRRKPAASAAKGAQASGGAAPVAPPPPKTYTKTEPGSWLGPLKLKIDGSTLTLQPKRAPGEKVPSLILDMRRQGITVLPNASLLPDDTPSVYGILGVVKLNTSMLIGVITKASRVRGLHDIRQLPAAFRKNQEACWRLGVLGACLKRHLCPFMAMESGRGGAGRPRWTPAARRRGAAVPLPFSLTGCTPPAALRR